MVDTLAAEGAFELILTAQGTIVEKIRRIEFELTTASWTVAEREALQKELARLHAAREGEK